MPPCTSTTRPVGSPSSSTFSVRPSPVITSCSTMPTPRRSISETKHYAAGDAGSAPLPCRQPGAPHRLLHGTLRTAPPSDLVIATNVSRKYMLSPRRSPVAGTPEMQKRSPSGCTNSAHCRCDAAVGGMLADSEKQVRARVLRVDQSTTLIHAGRTAGFVVERERDGAAPGSTTDPGDWWTTRGGVATRWHNSDAS